MNRPAANPSRAPTQGSVMQGSVMNPRRVIIWMTAAVFVILAIISILFFGGIPPWPVLMCFGVSHFTFCFIVSRVKPYRGPYQEPLVDPEASDWPEL